jgi:hypothetical protein
VEDGTAEHAGGARAGGEHAGGEHARQDAPVLSTGPDAPAAAFRELPLTARQLVPIALDLLWRATGQIRPASFYIGFLLLVTVGPAVAFSIAAQDLLGAPDELEPGIVEAWAGWYTLSLFIAGLGIVAALIESRGLAVAVVAATIEGRPLRLASAIAISRRVWWRVLIVGIVVAVPLIVGQTVGTLVLETLVGDEPAITVAGSLLGGILFVTPFAYAVAGIVLGEVRPFEAIRRSVGLFRARPRLALMVTLFGVISQLILFLALGAGLDLVARGIDVADGRVTANPAFGIALAAALVFASGTLIFLAEAIAATAQVHAFVALTHYARGLEGGRQDPLRVRWPWDPYVSRPLAVGILLNLLALIVGIGALPG